MDSLINIIKYLYDILPETFLELVNISITAGWIVIAVIILRLLFKKAPKWLNCTLWGIVGLRLCFPFDIQSAFSLIPSTQTIDPKTIYGNQFELNSGISVIDTPINDYMGGNFYEGVTVPQEFQLNITQILTFIWLAGMALMLIYAIASWAKLKFSLRTATKKEGNIYQSERVKSPFVLGLIKPKIYLPYEINEDDIALVTAHEKAHISRLDYLIKPLGFLLLSVHWFNPPLWIAYILLCRDIEAACDEKVIKNLGEDARRSYSLALLNASISRKSIAACPLAFGEVGVKERIKGVMNYKKPAFWVIIAAVAVCIIAAVCFLTNPRENGNYSYAVIMDEVLESAVEKAILDKNSKSFYGDFACQANHVLTVEGSGSKDDKIHTVTVYTMALYSRYSLDENGYIVETGGSIEPVAITFGIGENDNYTVLEYWQPDMGSEYSNSIKHKFPKGLDTNTQNYVDRLQTECDQKAREHFRAELKPIDTTEEYSTTAVIATNEDKTNTNEIPTNSPGGINQPVDDYLLDIVESKSSGMTWLTNEAFGKKYGYHVYLYCLDECYVFVGGVRYPLGDALNSGKVTAEAIVSKAAADAKNGKAISQMYKDGGSTVISYDDGGSTEYKAGGYAVIKKNTIDGNKDVFIGPSDMTLNQVNSFMEGVNQPDNHTTPNNKPTENPTDINGVTADISPEAEPNLSGRIKEIKDNLILMEVTYAQDGIKEGTPVYVRLDTVLSYAPDIDSLNLKKGDYISVVYDGRVMETYPLQIDAYAVHKAVT